MSTKYNELKNKVLFGKYSFDKIIGKGSFGCVFHGTNIKDNSEVAIKLEMKNLKDHLLELECNFLLLLKGYGIPDVKSYGRSGKFYALVLELLGINLKELKNSKKNFSLKDVSMLAIQIIDRIEYVHSKYIVHRDIKPENFLLGYKNSSTIYIIDFGISKKYRSSRTGKHIRYSKTGKIFGTIRYCTYNASLGLEQSRRDDLESIGHMLIYLAKGDLPWINIKEGTMKKRYFQILKIKKNISPKALCQNLPNEFLEYVKYCKNLKFEENPDYEYLRNLFRKILMNLNEINDKRFTSFSKINNLSNGIKSKDIDLSKDKYTNLLQRKDSSHKRLYRAIQKSLEKDEKFHKKTKTFLDLSSDTKTKLRDRSEDAIRKNKFNTIDSNISKDITSFNSRYVMYNMNIMELQVDDNLYDQLNIEPINSNNKSNKNSPDKENSFDIINNKNNQDIKSFDYRSNYFKKKSLILLLKEKANSKKKNINAKSNANVKLLKKKFNLSIDLDKNFFDETDTKIFDNKNRFFSTENRKNLNKKIKVNFKEEKRKIICKSIYTNIINKFKMEFVNPIIENKKEIIIDNYSNNLKYSNKINPNNLNHKNSSEISKENKKSNPNLKDNIIYNNKINHINNNVTKFIKVNNTSKRTKINSENISFDINNYLNKGKILNNEGKVNIIINNNNLNGFNNISSNDIIDYHQNMNSKYNNNSYMIPNKRKIINKNILDKKNTYKYYNNDDIVTNDYESYCYINKISNHKNKKDNSQLKQYDSEKSFKIYNKININSNREIQNKHINITNNNFEQNKRKIKILEYKSMHNDTEKSIYLKKDNINNKINNNQKNIYNLKENFIGNKNNNINYPLLSKKMFELKLKNANQMRTPSRHNKGANIEKMFLMNNYANDTVATSPNSNFSYVNINQKYNHLTYTKSPPNNINPYKSKNQINRKYFPKMNNNQRNFIGLNREKTQFYSPRNFKINDKIEYRLANRSADIKRNIDARSTSRTRKNKCINFNLENHIPKNVNRLNNINNISNYTRTKFFNMINV